MDIDKLSNKKNYKKTNPFKKIIIRLLILIILTIICLILIKKDKNLYNTFYKYLYNTNISFASINSWYEKKFGSPVPFENILNNSKPVFNEKLQFNKKEDYLDGVKLTVNKNYLVPALETGMVIFTGDKDNYKNTIIIEDIHGVETLYSNININVKIYDYIEKGTFLGETLSNELFITFKKDGEKLDYKKYIS